jgi:hypothetical protein
MKDRKRNRNATIKCITDSCDWVGRANCRGRHERLRHNIEAVLETRLCNKCYILCYQNEPGRVKPSEPKEVNLPEKRRKIK